MAENENKKIVLSKCTEFELRGKTYKVYPLSFLQLSELSVSLKELENKKLDVVKQAKLSSKVLYEILKVDNKDVTLEQVEATFTLEAFAEILKTAMGANSDVFSSLLGDKK